ncbi:hypothetical protein NC651_019047 [Populus alba x Populus x berolinensis]|nr:hypothetical protein NC651_019047 [Populus alba x Populus x berolinensis]
MEVRANFLVMIPKAGRSQWKDGISDGKDKSSKKELMVPSLSLKRGVRKEVGLQKVFTEVVY